MVLANPAPSLPCAHLPLNSSNMSGWSYLIDLPTRRKCKFNQRYGTSDLASNLFFFFCSHRFSVVKAHRATVTAKEREILAREQALLQNEQRLTALLNQKDQEITSLQQLVSQLQQQQHQFSRHDMEVAVKQAVARREEELRVLVMKREEEVAIAIAKREEEIMEAVRNREAEVDAACVQREELIKKEVDERIQWVLAKETELKAEEIRLEEVKRELDENAKKVQQQSAATTTTGKGLLWCLPQVLTLLIGLKYPHRPQGENPSRRGQEPPRTNDQDGTGYPCSTTTPTKTRSPPRISTHPVYVPHRFHGDTHFAPHSVGLYALRDEGRRSYCNRRNTRHALTR